MNLARSRVIIEEILRNGVDFFILSPGSRNAPLSLAAAYAGNALVTLHPDERGSAFVATGYAGATGKPAVLICTSGTAVANYLPAVVESSQSELPLLLLTADRPAKLRRSGAPQTIIQPGIFGEYVRLEKDLDLSSREIDESEIRSVVSQALLKAFSHPRGPVHINCQFDEPLVSPREISEIPRLSVNAPVKPCKELSLPSLKPDPDMIAQIKNRFRESRRGIIIAGPAHPHLASPDVLNLAERLQMPLLADITSNLRFCGLNSENLISSADLIFRIPGIKKALKPDLILQFGNIPVSRPFFEYLRDADAALIQVETSPEKKDPFSIVDMKCRLSPDEFCRTMANIEQTGQSELLEPFRSLEREVRRTVTDELAVISGINEPALAHNLLKIIPGDSGLYLANSMPVRDADAFGFSDSKILRIGVNRGASGIDGTIASAVGFAYGLQRISTVLVGDLAFIHDLNSLLLVRNSPLPVLIVVINNNGGGIFSFLPVAEMKNRFDEIFATPHNITFDNITRQFDLDYYRPASLPEFNEIYSSALKTRKSAVIEILSDRHRNREVHERIWSILGRKVKEMRIL